MMKNKLILLFSFVAIFYTNRLLSQSYDTFSCGGDANAVTPPFETSLTFNGVTLTPSYGSNVSMGRGHWVRDGKCQSKIDANRLHLGTYYSGEDPSYAYTYTITFNKKVNNLVILLAGGGERGKVSIETHKIVLDNGNSPTNISMNTSNCGTNTVDGNVLSISDTRVNGTVISEQEGFFRISSPNGFSKLTMSGPGYYAGSSMLLCSLSILPVTTSITTQPTNQTVCLNETKSISVTATGASKYQWYSSNSATDNFNGTPITGATSASYTPPSTTSGTKYYYARVYGSNENYITTNTITYTVQTITINSISPTTTACIGTPKTLTVTPSITSGTSYQWYQGTNSTNNTTGTPVGTDRPTYTPPDTNVTGTYYYYVKVTNNNCSTISSPIKYNVETCPTISALTSQSIGCDNNNTTKTISVTASGTGALSYQWYKNTVNAATVSSAYIINLATNSSYNIPPSTNSGTYFYVVVSNPSGNSITSSTIQYTKETCPEISAISRPTMACLGGTPSKISVTATGTGTLKYQWYKNSSESSTGGTIIDGAIDKDYTPHSDITNTKNISYFYVVISNETSGNSITSDPIKYSVVDCPAITSISTTQNFCINDTQSLIEVKAIGTGPLYIKWFKNANDNNTSGEEITGLDPTLMTYSAITSALGTLYYYVKISNTADFSGITITSNTIKVTINPCLSDCYKTPTNIGEGVPTKHGITSLNRANSDSNGWPMARKGAWTALESLTKGLVINRVETTAALDNFNDPKEGMIVYNEEAKCLMIYSTTDGTNYGWKCFDTQACPND